MLSSREHPNIAIGELLWDLLPAGPRLGGTTTNYAVLTARLGGYSALVSCVGEDAFGKKALDRLRLLALESGGGSEKEAHLNLSCVQTSAELPTGTVAVTVDQEGRPRYEIVTPVAWDAISPSPAAMTLAASASAICFGTLAQRDAVSRESIRSVLRAAGPDCMRVCDLNLRKPFCDAEGIRWSLAHADVIKISDEELPEVGRLLAEPILAAGLPGDGGDDLTAAAVIAARLVLKLAPHCQMVAITLGPHGSLLADRSGMNRHEGFRVEVADTIGAGDAFTAGMVHAFLREASLEAIGEVANRCGSYVASQPGATPEMPKALLERIQAVLDRSA
jgi:fructokinase